jgi:hypothetical protein
MGYEIINTYLVMLEMPYASTLDQELAIKSYCHISFMYKYPESIKYYDL